jgi:flavin-dependent dehydrogenase
VNANYDVVILGGGLAGLSLAIQLRQQFTTLQILVIERRTHPVPPAAHKVGESLVEIGAHYFDTVLGLREHLDRQQLKKFGFRFFFNEARAEVDQVLELGASRYLATPSYQLDRGIFENFLGEHARSLGVEFVDGAVVRSFDIGANGAAHRVRFVKEAASSEVECRWLIDAAWLARCSPPLRWLSTNHLCGEGYWAWLIPLSSGSHSVGIVCDAKLHPLETMNTFEKALEWFRVHQPRLAQEVESKRQLLQDFCFLRDFSYGCKQVFSADRWALTGEAGLFLDPFYSPGSDFIAIGNTYIADLIARDRAGEPFGGRAHAYQQLYFSFYESTLSLYTDQYAMFGDPEVLPVKVIWDYTYYWGVLCQLFFQRRLTDTANIARLSVQLNHAKALNLAMQNFMRAWSQVSSKRNDAVMLDQASLPWFAELNRGLRDELDEAGFRARIVEGVALLETLAREIVARALQGYPQVDASAVLALLNVPAATAATPLLFEDAA